MYTCFRCAKGIKGNAVMTNPPIYAIKLGVDFVKAYHPKCYELDERQAAKALGIEPILPHRNPT
jgi:hypothetical protein